MKKSYEMDMCSGPVLGKILIYSFPLMLSGILQLLFNAADVIVVGRYAGSQSLAAVGSTGALINLLINVFIGLSVGVNVLVAQYYGAKRDQDVNETVHTARSHQSAVRRVPGGSGTSCDPASPGADGHSRRCDR